MTNRMQPLGVAPDPYVTKLGNLWPSQATSTPLIPLRAPLAALPLTCSPKVLLLLRCVYVCLTGES